ncbi:hypothetical protein H2248_008897 [Termitomyces sp. 'cryptogamus']|nr:hypothetical protein H2248_008897 [Termitomyces sp. 'cryptogamus']
MGDANDEQDEDPGDVHDKQAAESNETQAEDNEYIEFNHYTQGSESEGLFALTETPATEHRVQAPSNKVHMHKVQIMLAKDAIDQPVLPAQDKECLVTWVEVNSHKAWILWDPGSTTSRLTLLFAHVAGVTMKVPALASYICIFIFNDTQKQ